MVSCRWEELYIWKKHILKHIGSGTHEAQLFTCKVCGWTSTGNNQPIDHCSQDHDLGENESKEKIVLKYLEIVGEEPQRPERPMKKEPVDSPENSPAPSSIHDEELQQPVHTHHCDDCEYSTSEASEFSNQRTNCHSDKMQETGSEKWITESQRIVTGTD